MKSAYTKRLEGNKQINKSEVAKEYLSGKTTEELGMKYKVHKGTIAKWIRSEGVELRDASQSKRIYNLNEHYFQKIDTPQKAYILGFIAADGFTYKNTGLGIALSKKDESVIDFIIHEMEITNPKRYFSRTLKDGSIGEYVEIRVNSLILHKDLESMGISNNKTLTLNLEEIIKRAKINNYLTKSLILGYFDGDGGIYHYSPKNGTEQFSMSVTGTKETCNYLLNLSNTGFIVKRKDNDTNNYTFQIGGRNKVKSFLEPLYNSTPDFYLKRKYNIYLKL